MLELLKPNLNSDFLDSVQGTHLAFACFAWTMRLCRIYTDPLLYMALDNGVCHMLEM